VITNLLIVALLFFFMDTVYNFIVAPTVRLKLRFKLFKNRDDLRRLRLKFPEKVTAEIYKASEESFNNTIAFLDRLTILNFIRVAMHLHKNEQYKNRVENRKKLFASCEVSEFQAMKKQQALIAMLSLLVNSIWLFILISIIMLIPLFYLVVKGTVMIAWARVQSVFEKVNCIPSSKDICPC
jgi:hypothetical protein